MFKMDCFERRIRIVSTARFLIYYPHCGVIACKTTFLIKCREEGNKARFKIGFSPLSLYAILVNSEAHALHTSEMVLEKQADFLFESMLIY